jgi:hypothetical protein
MRVADHDALVIGLSWATDSRPSVLLVRERVILGTGRDQLVALGMGVHQRHYPFQASTSLVCQSRFAQAEKPMLNIYGRDRQSRLLAPARDDPSG